MNPYKRLEAFENKHGEIGVLLENVLRYRPDSPFSEERLAYRKAESLFRAHSNIVHQCTGFWAASRVVKGLIRNNPSITAEEILKNLTEG